MCQLRTNIVSNCNKCKVHDKKHCPIRKKGRKNKVFTISKERAKREG